MCDHQRTQAFTNNDNIHPTELTAGILSFGGTCPAQVVGVVVLVALHFPHYTRDLRATQIRA